MSTVRDLGEFGLIERLTRIIGPQRPEEIVVDVGDDAAVVRLGKEFIILTTDTMVEGVHFLPSADRWEDVGWKAMASNVSDIAAMGGWPPYFALVTLALPPETPVETVDSLYKGLKACAQTNAVAVVGGDIVRSERISVTVALVGRARAKRGEPRVLRRDRAKKGDAIAVTGTLGDSAAGLRILQDGKQNDALVRRHLRPEPRPVIGVSAAEIGIRAAIDVSDGLLQDIGHICERSRVGATIRASDIPLSTELLAAFPDDALRMACTGGEDYELVLVGRKRLLEKLARELAPGDNLTVIGEITDDPENPVRLLGDDGKEIRYDQPGWDAFK